MANPLVRLRDNMKVRARKLSEPQLSQFHICEVVIERAFHDPALKRLDGARKPLIAQDGEDALLVHVFSVIGRRNGWCVEFGAWDGKHLSNTWHLIERHDWRGVLIEGDKARADRLPESYSKPDAHVFINAFVGWEGDNRLDALLAKTPVPKDFDLLSVDIDGNDWHVLDALKDYRPRVVIVEYNPSISNELRFVQARAQGVSQGASLRAFRDMMKTKGYELFFVTSTNALFVVADEYPKFGIANNAIAILNPCNEHAMQVFETFDGDVIVAARPSLIWKRRRPVSDALKTAIVLPVAKQLRDLRAAATPRAGEPRNQS